MTASNSVMNASINYWPGYLDALINVLITLLFALSVFAVFSVVLRSATHLARGVDQTVSVVVPVPAKNEVFTKAVVAMPEVAPIPLKVSISLSGYGLSAKKHEDVYEQRKRELQKLIVVEEKRQNPPVVTDKSLKSENRMPDSVSPVVFASRDVIRRISVPARMDAPVSSVDLLKKYGLRLLYQWHISMGIEEFEDVFLFKDIAESNFIECPCELVAFAAPDNPRQIREMYARLQVIRRSLAIIAPDQKIGSRIIRDSLVSQNDFNDSKVFLVSTAEE